MVLSLLAAAFVGACVFVSTYAVVKLQREEGKERTHEFAAYKISAGLEIAKAGAVAAIASEKAALLEKEAASLTADNLALQTVLLPRHIGIIGVDGRPKAEEYFSGLGTFSGTEVTIHFAPDTEAQNLANEIAIALRLFGWKPKFADVILFPNPLTEGVDVRYATGKPWTAEEPTQPWFAWAAAAQALANALTKAGLGIGQMPVSMAGLTYDPNDPSPSWTGVHVRIGARPVGATVQWIRSGRRDSLGNPPADTADDKK